LTERRLFRFRCDACTISPMPLAHTPFRPAPEVELLERKNITIEDAIAGLEECLSDSSGSRAHAQQNVPGSSLVNFRQIPRILEALRRDWVALPTVERPDGLFVEVHGHLEAHMHPCFMGERIVEGMRGLAGGILLHFNQRLQCVPLGFNLLKPAGPLAAVVGESPYLHFLIEFRAIGLVPRPGQRLLCRVGEIHTAIGVNLTLLNCFNFFVSKKDLPEWFHFDDVGQQWMTGDGEAKQRCFSKKRSVWVKVGDKAGDQGAGALSLCGTLCGAEFTGVGTAAASAPSSSKAASNSAVASMERKKRKSEPSSVALPLIEPSPAKPKKHRKTIA